MPTEANALMVLDWNPMQTKVAFIPNGLRYLVLPDPIEEKSETIGDVTIVSQVQAHKKSSSGIIVAVGAGVKNLEVYVQVPCVYKTGTHVLYGQYSGYAQELGGVDYVVLAESEILGELPDVPEI